MLSQKLFVNAEIHERDITLEDGSVERLHFKIMASSNWTAFQAALTDYLKNGPSDKNVEAVNDGIVASLCDPDGTRALTKDQAATLMPGVRFAIALALMPLHGLGAAVGKVLPPKATSGSGTSSSSTESVVAQ